MTALFPRTLTVPIALDDDPRYKGGIHDDAVAKAQGFKAALIPGAFVYGHISRIGIQAWGMDFATRGAMKARFRRPVYNGDVLTLTAAALVDEGGIARSEVSVRNEEGEEVATGYVALPHEAPVPPPLASLPVRPAPAERLPVVAGGLQVGTPLTSEERVLTAEDLTKSLKAFDEHEPIYGPDGIAHSGCLTRISMGNAYGGFRFPAPTVFTEGETQHYAPVRVGQRLATSGSVVAAYERKGRYYFESEEYLIADGREVVARFLRTSIYAND